MKKQTTPDEVFHFTISIPARVEFEASSESIVNRVQQALDNVAPSIRYDMLFKTYPTQEEFFAALKNRMMPEWHLQQTETGYSVTDSGKYLKHLLSVFKLFQLPRWTDDSETRMLFRQRVTVDMIQNVGVDPYIVVFNQRQCTLSIKLLDLY